MKGSSVPMPKGKYDWQTGQPLNEVARKERKVKLYRVQRKVRISYTRFIQAESRSEAELLADDLGTITANDAVDDSGWKAREAHVLRWNDLFPDNRKVVSDTE